MRLFVKDAPYPNLRMSVDQALRLSRDLIRAAQLALQIKQPHTHSMPMTLDDKMLSALVLTVEPLPREEPGK